MKSSRDSHNVHLTFFMQSTFMQCRMSGIGTLSKNSLDAKELTLEPGSSRMCLSSAKNFTAQFSHNSIDSNKSNASISVDTPLGNVQAKSDITFNTSLDNLHKPISFELDNEIDGKRFSGVMRKLSS